MKTSMVVMRVVVLGVVFCPASLVLGDAPFFMGLGDLPDGSFQSVASAVSADGSVVVGQGCSAWGPEAFHWENGVMTGLGDLPGGAFASWATDVSADGSVVVGRSTVGATYNDVQAFRWTQHTGLASLGDLAGGSGTSRAEAISADGSVIVGGSTSPVGFQAFRWTQASGMLGLGGLPGGRRLASRALGVSADGSVIVGVSDSASGLEAFRWEGGIMKALGDLPGGAFVSRALGVSADGSVVVGQGRSAWGREAFRWTEQGGMISLVHLPGDHFFTEATAVSADGSVIVGWGAFSGAVQAFIWDAGSGLRSLRDVLVNQVGLDLTGWTLVWAWDISADGKTIVGAGYNRRCHEAWIAHIPEPAATLSLDIKPSSCPNPLNRKSRGMLPVAILGTDDFDVSTIDTSTILLTREDVEGDVAPVRVRIEDVGMPFEGDLCDCHDLDRDGFLDLVLKFRTQDVVAALDLNSLSGGESPTLTVTGNLEDGKPFTASDCVWLAPAR